MKDTSYYDALELQPTASQAQIKKSYYVLAMRYHPDKNPNNKEAEEKFKQISEAYQILSDETLRKQYDTYGKTSVSDIGFANPQEFFRNMFGGERFETIIGEMLLAKILGGILEEEIARQQEEIQKQSNEREMKEEVKEESEKIDSKKEFKEETEKQKEDVKKEEAKKEEKRRELLSAEKQQQFQQENKKNICTLVNHLIKKATLYTSSLYTPSEFAEYITLEAASLFQESYGPQLLESVGYVYLTKAKQHLGRNSFLGMTGIYHSFKEKTHIVGQLFSTVSAVRNLAKEMESSKLTEGNETGMPDISEETLNRAMWKASNFLIEGTLREVCEVFLKYNEPEQAYPELDEKSNEENKDLAGQSTDQKAEEKQKSTSSTNLSKSDSSSSSSLSKKEAKELFTKRALALKIIGTIYLTTAKHTPTIKQEPEKTCTTVALAN